MDTISRPIYGHIWYRSIYEQNQYRPNYGHNTGPFMDAIGTAPLRTLSCYRHLWMLSHLRPFMNTLVLIMFIKPYQAHNGQCSHRPIMDNDC